MNDDFAQACERLERFKARDHDLVGPSGRTLALLHPRKTPKSALLLHGLTSGPKQFVSIGQALFERGFNVIVPRLPRHGHADRLSRALADLTADELKAIAAESLEIARGLGECVTVTGFSMGGLLAAWIAQTQTIDRAVPLIPFLGVIGVPMRVAPLAASLALRMPNAFRWWDPIKRERQLAHEVLAAARTQPPRAKTIVVVTNKHESAVNNRATARLVAAWRQRRPDVQTFSFENLPISHDIIEPQRHSWTVERVYPDLLRLLAS